MKKLCLALVSAMALTACQNSNIQSPPSMSYTSSSVSIPSIIGWKEYQNEKYGIRFSYPSNWEIHESTFGTSDLLMTLQSPETKERITEAMKHIEMYEGTDGPGPSSDLEITFCSQFTKSDCTYSTLYWYSAEKMKYTNLTDMFADKIYNHVQKIGERMISDKKAYEVRLPDSFDPFGILIEHSKGVLVIKFSSYINGSVPSKSSMEEAIASTIQLQ